MSTLSKKEIDIIKYLFWAFLAFLVISSFFKKPPEGGWGPVCPDYITSEENCDKYKSYTTDRNNIREPEWGRGY